MAKMGGNLAIQKAIGERENGDAGHLSAASTNVVGVSLPRQRDEPHQISSANSLLSLREREVVLLLAAGQSGNNIAEILKISVHTARVHIRNIIRKTRAKNIPHAVALAFVNRILQVTDPRLGERECADSGYFFLRPPQID
jgi:DNA-binding CsgD family transcriptional regulator